MTTSSEKRGEGSDSASVRRRASRKAAALRRGSTTRRRVFELMSPDVVCARPEMTVGQVAKLLHERRVGGAPVVDDGGRIVGVVSQNDLTRYLAERGGVAEEGRFFTELDEYHELSRIPADRSRTSVQEVMRPKVFTVARDAGVAMAANIMRERGIHRLFVTERGVLVGEITALDLLLVVEELMARLDG